MHGRIRQDDSPVDRGRDLARVPLRTTGHPGSTRRTRSNAAADSLRALVTTGCLTWRPAQTMTAGSAPSPLPGRVGVTDSCGQLPIAIESGMLVDGHGGLGGVSAAGLKFGGGGAVLAGEGQGRVAQMVNRQVGTSGGVASDLESVHEIANAHVVAAFAGEQK